MSTKAKKEELIVPAPKNKLILGFHKPDEPYGFLSNWYPAKFELAGHTFCNTEQYMMYMKAIAFNDIDIAKKILRTSDPSRMRSLGRKVANYDQKVWSGIRQIAVYDANLAKFRQNPELGKQLRDTGDFILCECALTDRIWGIGLSLKSNNYKDMSNWKGQNLLGFTLMMVRNTLNDEAKEAKSDD